MEDSLDDKFFWRYGYRKPIKVRGGVKAQTRRFGGAWWSEKWLEAIEKFGPSKRVARGRSYARKGQVLELTLNPGIIHAVVQGSREEPYRVEIQLQQVPLDARTELLNELQTQPIFTATLLSGEIPAEIEKVFHKYETPLFPTRAEGRSAQCSCPDASNICKHIAAIYYLISVELQRDPFLLLLLRGIRRELLTAQNQGALFQIAVAEPLPADARQFWKIPRVQPVSLANDTPETGRSGPAILQRLGAFPMWRGESDFMKTMERIYQSAKELAGKLI